MQIGATLQNISNYYRIEPRNDVRQTAAVGAPAGAVNDIDLLRAQGQLLRLLESVQEIDRLVNARKTRLTGLPSARSEPSLGLDLSSTAAALQSTEEINATPTSFTPFRPDWWWGGSSSALLTLGGAYDGSSGSGFLTFQARRSGVRGVDELRIRVRDPASNILANIRVRVNDPLDQQYDIGNGLFFTLGSGSLVDREWTGIELFDSVGSVVDPDKAFNGTGNEIPNLQYGLPEVVAGNFLLNGVQIEVGAGDSINDVLDTINAAGAGVTASFNAVTERIEFTQLTPGAAPTIDIQGDDSNFVQATKLDSAVVLPGLDPENQRALQVVTQFAGVSSGTVLVNGQAVAVDVANDSLEDVLTRINESEAGVTASFDAESQRVEIGGANPGEAINIDSNGTGLFGALGILEGRLDPRPSQRGYSRRQAQRINQAIADSVGALNDFFRETNRLGSADPAVQNLRNQLKDAFASVFGSDSSINTGLGLRFELSVAGSSSLDFATVDRYQLSKRLRDRGAEIKQLLNGTEQQAGLLQAISQTAQGAMQQIANTLGTKGTLFSASV